MSKADSLRSSLKSTPVLPMLVEFLKSTIELEMKSFNEYIVDSRKSIQKQQRLFKKKIDERINSSPDGVEEIYDWYADEYFQYNEFYPTTFHNSTLISLYSFFEFNLKHICFYLHRIQKFKIKPKDLAGENYIEKSKKYLTLVVGVDLSDLDPIWNELTKFQQLRNCIVHNNSNIKQKDQKISTHPLYQFIIKNPNLQLNENKGTFIINNDQLLLDFSDTIKKYLLSILAKI